MPAWQIICLVATKVTKPFTVRRFRDVGATGLKCSPDIDQTGINVDVTDILLFTWGRAHMVAGDLNLHRDKTGKRSRLQV